MKPRRLLVLLTLSLLFAPLAASQQGVEERTLSFYHTHTKRELEVTYYRDGYYDQNAMLELRTFLADWRDQEEHDIDPQLMDILWSIQKVAGHVDTWEVISAYRSPRTNELLRSRSSGVARSSMHLEGRAIDVRLRGLPLKQLRDIALKLRRGGVGYYPKSDFVHLDTGRVRRW